MVMCPACGSTSSEQIGSMAPGFTMTAADEVFSQPDYSIRECKNCGLLFRTPTLSEAELARYYARTDFHRWDLAGFFPTERGALALLKQLPNGSAILDFGCSSGRLLAPLTATHRCFGVEVNEAAAAEAANKGI